MLLDVSEELGMSGLGVSLEVVQIQVGEFVNVQMLTEFVKSRITDRRQFLENVIFSNHN